MKKAKQPNKRHTEKVAQTTPNLIAEQAERLREIFPEAFTEGKVDWEKLKATLGEIVENGPERYRFTWAGKQDAIRLLQAPSRATLIPCPEESVNWESTQNLFVEGDNLEVLKLLYKAYFGRVKMIYIDPPYNTGNDFIYPDNYTDPLDTYLQLTGQKDTEGNLLTSNPETSGRYHSAWLSMMYPRLFVARQLLREDGVIFVSIDDNEVYNLRVLMNEIFGEENFVACIANVNNPKGRSDDKYIATAHEYILIYKKSDTQLYGWDPDENILRRYKPVYDGRKRREIDLRKTGDNDRREDRPNLFYYFLFNPTTGHFLATKDVSIPKGYIQIMPLRKDGSQGNWRWELDKSNRDIHKLVPKLMPVRKVWSVFELDYLEEREVIKPTSAWTMKDVNSERGSEQFIELGFPKELFPRPKPLGLLKRILHFAIDPLDESIILDFFAGSSGIAQAILELNREDGGNRRFIMVQLPEPLDSPQTLVDGSLFNNIAEIGKERIRRVINKLKNANNGQQNLEPRETPEDLGFRVFKLAESNFRQWAPPEQNDLEAAETQMEMFANPLVEGWMAERVIHEVALKEAGYGLNCRIEPVSGIKTNKVWLVTDPDKEQHFRISLDETLSPKTMDALKLQKDDLFICRDIALDDTLAANLALQCRLKTI